MSRNITTTHRSNKPYVIVLLYFSFLLLLGNGTALAELPVLGLSDSGQNPFAQVYEKLAPSIVRIDVKGEVAVQQRGSDNPWEWFFQNPQQQQRQRPVEGMGSGVIIDREGHVLTNNHVIADATEIKVKVNEDESYDAEVVGTDPETDLAVIKLKLNGIKLPEHYIAELGDSDTLKPGDYAIAIGNPIGLERTINVGVISAIGRHGFNVAGSQGPQFQNFIQTDAQINPGNSGGALADINGKVIGINDMYNAQYAGIGFAIPINLAKNISKQLIASGDVKRGFVGIKGGDITDEFKDALDLETKDGVMIHEVLKDTPAEEAGLEHGDIITTLEGTKIKNFQQFLFKVADYAPGTTIALDVIHEGKNKSVKLKLADRETILAQNDSESPSAETQEESASWRGLHVADVDNPMSKKFNLGSIKQGVVIVKIDEGSPAAETNLREGDVISEIGLTKITSLIDYRKAINDRKNKEKTVLIYRHRAFTNGRVEKGFVALKST